MDSLNQKILQTQKELLTLLQQSAKETRSTAALRAALQATRLPANRKTKKRPLKPVARALQSGLVGKRGIVAPWHGIRPAILDVLVKSRKQLKRGELASRVAKRAPRGVSWSLGSCNLALASLIKERMLTKEEVHGGEYDITAEGLKYLRAAHLILQKRTAA